MWLCTYRRTTLAINVLNWLHHRLARLDAIYLSALSSEIYAQQFPFCTRARIHMRFAFDLYEYCSVNIIRFGNKWASVIELNTRSCFLYLALFVLDLGIVLYARIFVAAMQLCIIFSFEISIAIVAFEIEVAFCIRIYVSIYHVDEIVYKAPYKSGSSSQISAIWKNTHKTPNLHIHSREVSGRTMIFI